MLSSRALLYGQRQAHSAKKVRVSLPKQAYTAQDEKNYFVMARYLPANYLRFEVGHFLYNLSQLELAQLRVIFSTTLWPTPGNLPSAIKSQQLFFGINLDQSISESQFILLERDSYHDHHVDLIGHKCANLDELLTKGRQRLAVFQEEGQEFVHFDRDIWHQSFEKLLWVQVSAFSEKKTVL